MNEPACARRRLRDNVVVALAVLLLTVPGPLVPPAGGDGGVVHVSPPVRSAVHQSGTARVLVELRLPGGPHVPEGDLPSPAAVLGQRADISDGQLQVLARLAGKRYREIHKYETVPLLALEIDAAGLAELEAAGIHVTRVVQDELSAAGLAQSVPLIEADQSWARGFDGTGIVIAILDTGVDAAHPFLAGKVVEEGCFSSGPASVCPNGLRSQIGAGAGRNCPAAVDGCAHGTHVAGIAAGNGTGAGQSFSGVARGAQIIAMQVFSRIDDVTQCRRFGRPAPCVLSYDADQIKALERVYSLRAVYSIAAVNMSLGGGPSTTTCDSDTRKLIIDQLRAAGIATVVAAGNDGEKAAINKPACISSAISVGATTKSDLVASFSNVAAFMSLFAPGASIDSSVPGGSFAIFNGTSMAAPHVTGAWAILRQAAPEGGVSEVLAALQDTGLPITDTRSGGAVTRPRIRTVLALNRFVGQTASLAVIRSGLGSGTVASAPAGIACGPTCSASYALGTAVTLTATATAGSTFLGWSGGGCSGTGTCTVAVTATTTVTASFGAGSLSLSLNQAGGGTGTVTSSPGGITCGSACAAGFSPGTLVTLTAAAAPGSTFTGWSGDCAGTASTCSVTMSQARSVTATFTSTTHTITITRAPIGAPNPVASGGAVSVTVAATDSLGHGLSYVWTATCLGLGSGGSFASAAVQSPAWTAPSNTTGVEQICTLEVTVRDGFGLSQVASYTQRVSPAASPSTIFADDMERGTGAWSPQAPWGLTAAVAHSGSRSWTDSPGGHYANEVNASLFSPVLDLSGLSSATLTFWHRYDLEDGFDFGNVWVTIDRGASYTQLTGFTGTNLTWSPVSLDLSRFAGVSNVQVVFQLFSDRFVDGDGWYIDDVAVSGVRIGLPLTVVKAGGDGGTVTSGPSGIVCGATCSANFVAGATVALTVSVSPGWRFVGWSGAGCSGTLTCTVRMSAATSVTATFSRAELPGDDRAGALSMTGDTFTDSRVTQEYTSSPDDPVQSCTGLQNGHTVWYRFTATRAGTATIQTRGSSYDTVVSVHDATTLAEVPGGCHDDVSIVDRSSLLSVNVAASTTYLVQVSAYGSANGGTLALSFAFAALLLPGDDRGAPIPITSEQFLDARPTNGHTVDTTDPVHSCTGQRDGHTVWYRFTPTRSGVATITTHGSNYDTVLSVYQASTLSEAPGACHDDIANNDLSSVLQVTMLAGVQYLIEVSAFGGSPGGDLALAVTFSTTASAHVIMELTQVRLGQTFTFGFLAQNPVGSPPADLYLGYLAPDLRTVVFYRELGPQTTAPYEMPALFSAHKAAPGGYAESKPGYLGIALPAGAQTGTYRFFAALVRQGAFVDNRIEPDDVLALDVKLVEVSP